VALPSTSSLREENHRRCTLNKIDIDATAIEILKDGLVDWIQIADIAATVREAAYGELLMDGFPQESGSGSQDELIEDQYEWVAVQERRVFPDIIQVVKYLLRQGWVEIGELGDAPGFTPWQGGLSELEERLDAVAATAGFPLFYRSPMLFWLRNTPAGSAQASTR
jgi:hypothetical protein